jgi:N-acetylmuramoyl-L-alanine amidase
MEKKKILAAALALTLWGLQPKQLNITELKPKPSLESRISSKTGKQENKFPIIIDPGHGGEDTGACVKGICEDEISYDIATRVTTILKAKGYETHQTIFDETTKLNPQTYLKNNKDEFLWYRNQTKKPLSKKMIIERSRLIDNTYKLEKNPMLVSIHANSTKSYVRGFSIYYPSKEEYSSEEVEIKSKKLAEIIGESLKKNKIPSYSIDIFGILNWGIEDVRGGFNRENFKPAIFDKTKIKTKVIVECGNLRNNNDFSMLLKHENRQKIAYSIAEGIIKYQQQ